MIVVRTSQESTTVRGSCFLATTADWPTDWMLLLEFSWHITCTYLAHNVQTDIAQDDDDHDQKLSEFQKTWMPAVLHSYDPMFAIQLIIGRQALPWLQRRSKKGQWLELALATSATGVGGSTNHSIAASSIFDYSRSLDSNKWNQTNQRFFCISWGVPKTLCS